MITHGPTANATPDAPPDDPCPYCLWSNGAKRLRPTAVLFSHDSDEWETPHALFHMLDHEFRFNLDVCATPTNAKCARFFTKDDDGLRQDWENNVCWMNPPYSQLREWLHKAHESSTRGATVLCLTFARTDTAGFHDAVAHASEIRFLRGRLRFGKAKHSAPAPSCLIIFRPRATQPPAPVQVSFGFNNNPPGINATTINPKEVAG